VTKPWYRQKTTWAAVIAFLTALGGLLTGEIAWATAYPAMSTALIGMFLRQGVQSIKKKPVYLQKTTLTGVATALGAVGGVLAGGLTWPVALPTIATSLLGAFLRQGVEKGK